MFNDRKHMPLFGFLCVCIFLKSFLDIIIFKALLNLIFLLTFLWDFSFIEIASAWLF